MACPITLVFWETSQGLQRNLFIVQFSSPNISEAARRNWELTDVANAAHEQAARYLLRLYGKLQESVQKMPS